MTQTMENAPAGFLREVTALGTFVAAVSLIVMNAEERTLTGGTLMKSYISKRGKMVPSDGQSLTAHVASPLLKIHKKSHRPSQRQN